MKVEFRNMAPVKRADIDIRQLTVLIGPNSRGNTHIANTLAMALDHAHLAAESLCAEASGDLPAHLRSHLNTAWAGATGPLPV